MVVEVETSLGQLTVDVRDVPFAEVLERIAQLAKFDLILRGDVGARVTESFAGLPLEEGIRRLARGHSVAVTYAAAERRPGEDVLVSVLVVRDSSAPAAGPFTVGGSPRASRPSVQSEPTASSAMERAGDEQIAAATAKPPLAGWIAEIQKLADEASRGGEAAAARLAEMAVLDADPVVRERAVAALGRVPTSATEPPLIAALADVDVAVRVRAVRGLRGFRTDTSMQSIAGVVINDASPEVRLAALAALGSLSGPRVLEGLTNATADPDAMVRGTAVRWLAWWTTRPPSAH